MPGLQLKYFVLKPKSKDITDPYAHASRMALKAYARSIKSTDPALARDLERWIVQEEKAKMLLKK